MPLGVNTNICKSELKNIFQKSVQCLISFVRRDERMSEVVDRLSSILLDSNTEPRGSEKEISDQEAMEISQPSYEDFNNQELTDVYQLSDESFSEAYDLLHKFFVSHSNTKPGSSGRKISGQEAMEICESSDKDPEEITDYPTSLRSNACDTGKESNNQEPMEVPRLSDGCFAEIASHLTRVLVPSHASTEPCSTGEEIDNQESTEVSQLSDACLAEVDDLLKTIIFGFLSQKVSCEALR